MKALMKSLHFTSSTWVLLMNATFFPFLLAYRFLLSRSLSHTRMHTLSHTLALSLTQACTYTLALSRTSQTNLSLLKFCCVFSPHLVCVDFLVSLFVLFLFFPISIFFLFLFLILVLFIILSLCKAFLFMFSVLAIFLSHSLSLTHFYLSCSILLFSQSTYLSLTHFLFISLSPQCFRSFSYWTFFEFSIGYSVSLSTLCLHRSLQLSIFQSKWLLSVCPSLESLCSFPQYILPSVSPLC